jgi:hypothetical protein
LAVIKGRANVDLASNAHLGGEDFDNDLVNHFVQGFKRKNKKAEYNLFYSGARIPGHPYDGDEAVFTAAE